MEQAAMKQELLKLLFDYCIVGKTIDKYYIERLIETVVDAKDLFDYVVSVEILNSSEINKNAVAAYNQSLKRIKIFTEGILYMLFETEKTKSLFNSKEQIFFQNVLITQTILHELEHANQKKIIASDTSIESDILRLSSCDVSISQKEVEILMNLGLSQEQIEQAANKLFKARKMVYLNNYDISPEERLAEIKSLQTIVELLSLIKKYTPALHNYECMLQLKNMLLGYEFSLNNISSPTIDFILLLDRKEELSKLGWYDENSNITFLLLKRKFSLKERMIYGLPIDQEEYETAKKIIKMSNRHNI